MIDIVREIEAVERAVGDGAGDGSHSVRLRRDYEAPIDDVWDALTNPDRIGRWFLPISSDYRLGGTYQFEGNAGGRILDCDRPNRLHVTWEYGPGEPSGCEGWRRGSETSGACSATRAASASPSAGTRSSAARNLSAASRPSQG